jgi:hypothetical protein
MMSCEKFFTAFESATGKKVRASSGANADGVKKQTRFETGSVLRTNRKRVMNAVPQIRDNKPWGCQGGGPVGC